MRRSHSYENEQLRIILIRICLKFLFSITSFFVNNIL